MKLWNRASLGRAAAQRGHTGRVVFRVAIALGGLKPDGMAARTLSPGL